MEMKGGGREKEMRGRSEVEERRWGVRKMRRRIKEEVGIGGEKKKSRRRLEEEGRRKKIERRRGMDEERRRE